MMPRTLKAGSGELGDWRLEVTIAKQKFGKQKAEIISVFSVSS
jgi:hypothetical protein